MLFCWKWLRSKLIVVHIINKNDTKCVNSTEKVIVMGFHEIFKNAKRLKNKFPTDAFCPWPTRHNGDVADCISDNICVESVWTRYTTANGYGPIDFVLAFARRGRIRPGLGFKKIKNTLKLTYFPRFFDGSIRKNRLGRIFDTPKKINEQKRFRARLAWTTNDVLPREGQAKKYIVGNTVHNRIDYAGVTGNFPLCTFSDSGQKKKKIIQLRSNTRRYFKPLETDRGEGWGWGGMKINNENDECPLFYTCTPHERENRLAAVVVRDALDSRQCNTLVARTTRAYLLTHCAYTHRVNGINGKYLEGLIQFAGENRAPNANGVRLPRVSGKYVFYPVVVTLLLLHCLLSNADGGARARSRNCVQEASSRPRWCRWPGNR